MRVLKARNVNDLFIQGLELLEQDGVKEQTRAGPAIVAPWPVTSVYERPMERVLFCEKRDANPFFHLAEGLWMLSGSNDPSFLDHYIHDFSKRFADDGVIHGAYGHRWRTALGFDQLDQIVTMLRNDPGTRQAVLQMWDGANDEFKYEGLTGDEYEVNFGNDDLGGIWKDRPCNTHCYFRVRQLTDPLNQDGLQDPVLDMTILCRSNDIVWGAYGANTVHFSMLQEYVAGRVGVSVGTMYQVSNNYHGYISALDKIGDPMKLSGLDLYEASVVSASPMGEDWDHWDADLRRFMEWHEALWRDDAHLRGPDNCANIWFHTVAAPVALANWFWKQKRWSEARTAAGTIDVIDWQYACNEWLNRRMQK